jgi:transcriptional regulator with XRE-family HTH domain
MSTIGERVREIRGDVTQAEFAARFSVPKHTVRKWENDESPPDFKILQKMIVEHELSPEWLLLGEGPKNAPPLEDFSQRTVPAKTYYALVDEWNERVEIHRKKLEELASLKEIIKKAMHEIMELNAENRVHRRNEKLYQGYLAAAVQARDKFADDPGLGLPPKNQIDPNVAGRGEHGEYREHGSAFDEHAVSADDVLGIPVDPDVADYKSAFEEHAVSGDDVIEDGGSAYKKGNPGVN